MAHSINVDVYEMDELSPETMARAIDFVRNSEEFYEEMEFYEEDLRNVLQSMLQAQGFRIGAKEWDRRKREWVWNPDAADMKYAGFSSQGDGASVGFSADESIFSPLDKEKWREHCSSYASEEDIHKKVPVFREILTKSLPEKTLVALQKLVESGGLRCEFAIERSGCGSNRYVHEMTLDSHSRWDATDDLPSTIEKALEQTEELLLEYARDISRAVYRSLESYSMYLRFSPSVSAEDCSKFNDPNERDLLPKDVRDIIHHVLDYAESKEIMFSQTGEIIDRDILDRWGAETSFER